MAGAVCAATRFPSLTANAAGFREAVLDWYALYGRKDLPWRHTDDPYHVYVSEIMLQQTQVATVLSRFYFPFLDSFPSLSALAESEEETLLKAWQGLGYYNRARNMRRAAQAAAPALPDNETDLRALPGIGRYTAGAILCFGFKQRAALVDTNIKRLYCRLTASERIEEEALYQLAEKALPEDNIQAFDFNQALLDIGATICTARKAACIICPLSEFCEGKGAPEKYPEKKAKKAVPVRHSSAVILRDENGALAMTARDTVLLGGYYTLPVIPESAIETYGLRRYGKARQQYSHFISDITVYAPPPGADIAEIAASCEKPPVFYSDEAASALPLSGIDKKLLAIAAGG